MIELKKQQLKVVISIKRVIIRLLLLSIFSYGCSYVNNSKECNEKDGSIIIKYSNGNIQYKGFLKNCLWDGNLLYYSINKDTVVSSNYFIGKLNGWQYQIYNKDTLISLLYKENKLYAFESKNCSFHLDTIIKKSIGYNYMENKKIILDFLIKKIEIINDFYMISSDYNLILYDSKINQILLDTIFINKSAFVRIEDKIIVESQNNTDGLWNMKDTISLAKLSMRR